MNQCCDISTQPLAESSHPSWMSCIQCGCRKWKEPFRFAYLLSPQGALQQRRRFYPLSIKVWDDEKTWTQEHFASLHILWLTCTFLLHIRESVSTFMLLKKTSKTEFNFTKMSKWLVQDIRCDISLVVLRHTQQDCCAAKRQRRPTVTIHRSQAVSNKRLLHMT